MDINGWKWLKWLDMAGMAGNGWICWIWLEMAGRAENG